LRISDQRLDLCPPAVTTEQLFDSCRRDGNQQARQQLIERFLPLARRLAGRYARSREPYEDLVQVASVGLIKAIERFDPEHGTAFPAFAVPTILGELKRHFRDTSWSVKVDRRAKERARAVIGAQRALTAVGRAPTVADIAQLLECDAEEVLEGLQAAIAYSPVSLDMPVARSAADDREESTLLGRVAAADEPYELVDERATIDAAVQHLTELERRILQLRFREDLSQRQIAELLGVSQMHVSRLLRRTLARLRELLDPE
jgi:RNA polymerase sigma-B factor